jgi:hypothetical protein
VPEAHPAGNDEAAEWVAVAALQEAVAAAWAMVAAAGAVAAAWAVA